MPYAVRQTKSPLPYGNGSKNYKTAPFAKTYLGVSPKLFVKSAQVSSAKEAARAYSPCRLSALERQAYGAERGICKEWRSRDGTAIAAEQKPKRKGSNTPIASRYFGSLLSEQSHPLPRVRLLVYRKRGKSRAANQKPAAIRQRVKKL